MIADSNRGPQSVLTILCILGVVVPDSRASIVPHACPMCTACLPLSTLPPRMTPPCLTQCTCAPVLVLPSVPLHNHTVVEDTPSSMHMTPPIHLHPRLPTLPDAHMHSLLSSSRRSPAQLHRCPRARPPSCSPPCLTHPAPHPHVHPSLHANTTITHNH